MSTHVRPEPAERVAGSSCPKCGKFLDGVAGMTGTRRPKPGDWTVCAYCVELLRFGDRLRLCRLTQAELDSDPDAKASLLFVASLLGGQ